MEREIYTPKLENVPPMPELRTLYRKLGEEKLRELVDVFYDLIAKSEILGMFPGDFDSAKQDQADFLIQVLGGPSYYTDRKGPARMRMRHFQFVITEESRLVWLGCYRQALDMVKIPDEERQILDDYLDSFSKWMVNAKSDSEQ
ncbi:MAG: bacitracin resistance protein BacA [Leptospira sp.]|nr:bacitracin resistance protein BacA [Leptospira sp.]